MAGRDPVFIVNPRSGGGRGQRLGATLEALARLRFSAFTVRLTESPGHARALAREAGQEGVGLVVAVGGDGTASEVAAGLLDLDSDRRPALGIVPGGRGSDFARGVGIPARVEDALDLLTRPPRPCDAGRIVRGDRSGWFLNIADAGLGGFVVATMDSFRLPVASALGYLFASVGGLLRFRGAPMRVTLDDGTVEGEFLAVAVANGRYFGSGMLIAAEASPSDGLFDVVRIEARSLPRVFAIVPHLYAGTLGGRPGITITRSRRVTIESSGPVPLDVDGEKGGDVPVTFEVCPAALRVHMP